MKKLLVLALVLSVASLATAGLTLGTAGSTASIVSDNADAYNIAISWTSTLDVASAGLTAMAAAGNLSEVQDFGVNDMGAAFGLPQLGIQQVYAVNVASSTAGVLQPGAGYEVTFNGIAGFGETDMGMGQVNLIDSTSGALVASAYVVPEPATMALLGLGALVLRRKK